ncbi:glycerophosphoryl diester phosphodiesterase membrane domain-containing protein [Enterococcus alishanensis]|uniref:Glycerophosphodiester phosphodiesterase n=1 Tax=Enterococcus alishanensis TaxID=1303817 RepID=A0ABS6TEX2_9ENTE|nr:glycerophosphodiester phosphodiesterase [Enterococcus alishanensis]MBV7391450.1 glycerophosphodiester phosphodiesterase [Enterococcus alishanensis]
MPAIRFFFTYSKEFLRRWGSYTLLIIGTNLALTYIAIPVFQFLTAEILKLGNIPYVSNTNILNILTKHPAVLAALLLLMLLIFALIFWQFTFQLLGIRVLQTNSQESFWRNFKTAILQMRYLRPGTFFFFIFYFILILPFANAVFRTPLLSKVTIPVFILDYLANNWAVSLLLLLLSGIVYYIGIRLLFVLPLMIFKQYRAWAAVRESWQLTAKHFWRYVLQIFFLSFVLSLISGIGFEVSYLLQVLFDQLPGKLPLIFAMLNLTGVQMFSQFMIGWTSVLYFSLLVQKFYPLVVNEENALKIKWVLWTRLIAGAVILIFGGSALIANGLYLAGLYPLEPLVISHRGVDNQNGVQNTIPAMTKTMKIKPDYIEMDIHETKDHQFVVMHDENLKKLTGVNKAPYQLTLAELTELTAHENGYSAKIASFDDYLAYANQHKQKLLIEIKTTSHDSKDMLERFIQKYQQNILTNQHQIQSLDYQVVSGLKEKAPKLFVSYILPFNLTFPQTVANAYTMEETTLTSEFIEQATSANKQVYAWTVNDSDSMDRMMFMGADGIITDNITLLKEQIKNFQDNPSYAKRIELYINRLPSFDGKPQEN